MLFLIRQEGAAKLDVYQIFDFLEPQRLLDFYEKNAIFECEA
jgi:hypothetical protein